MQGSKVVVIGSVNTDMIIKSAHIPRPGETVIGGEFFCVPGGKGANQAVAAARLGSQVTLIACVGDDQLGDQAIAGFRQEGINVENIFRSNDMPTGVALIMVGDDGENLISVASGANYALTADHVHAVADIIRGAGVLMLQLETTMEVVLAAAQIAHNANVPVILDPAPAPNTSLDPHLLKCVSYITPNESEASRLTDLVVDDEKTAEQAAQQLLATGPGCTILTLGSAGALVCTREQSILIESFPVSTVDSTAAGDAFNGGLAAAIAAGKPLLEAVVQACASGALASTRIGAQPSLPYASELIDLVKSRRQQ